MKFQISLSVPIGFLCQRHYFKHLNNPNKPNRILSILTVSCCIQVLDMLLFHAVFKFLICYVCNELMRHDAPQYRATTCLDILWNDQCIEFTCRVKPGECCATQNKKNRYTASTEAFRNDQCIEFTCRLK